MSIGKFIVLEGLDGSGKSTQAALLTKNLSEVSCSKDYSSKPINCSGIPMQKNAFSLLTAEPTKEPIGALSRRAFSGDITLSREALILILIADRLEHLSTLISPALERGNTIVCDRYYLSNMAYQATSSLSAISIYELNKNFHIPTPDLTIYLDIAPETALQRIKKRRGESGIFDNLDTLRAIADNYLQSITYLKSIGENIVSVCADEPPEQIAKHILAATRVIAV